MVVVSIVVPAFNEVRTIEQVLNKIGEQKIDGFSLEIIVIDDGSTDGSQQLLASRPDLYSKFIPRQSNGGKGAAVKDGLRAATGHYVLIQDADLEYDPVDYTKLFRPIREHSADVVMGSRFVAPEITRIFYFSHKIGNMLITLIFNLLNNTTFTDVYSGYLVYRRSLIDGDTLRTTGWEQHAEMLTRAVRSATTIYEVPVSYHGRTYAEGKKIKGRHVFAIIATIIGERFRVGVSKRSRAAKPSDARQYESENA
jgi:glycosyltransferase involved in cell wall biosynthesis